MATKETDKLLEAAQWAAKAAQKKAAEKTDMVVGNIDNTGSTGGTGTSSTAEQIAATKAAAPQQNTLNSVAHLREDNKEAYINQVGAQANQVAQNPSITDTSRVNEILSGITAPEGKYISKDEVGAAMEAGYRVTQKKDANGNIVYYQSGVQRVDQEGTSGADEAHLSDEAYVYKQQATEQWWLLESQIQAAKAAGNTDLAASLRGQQKELQNNMQTLRYANGYLGGTDGSMYIPLAHLEEGGTNNLGEYNDYDPRTGGLSSSLAGNNSAQIGLPSAPVLGDLTGKVEDYSSYLEQMYAAKKAAALAEIEAAYKQNVAALDRAGEGMEASYQDARNQTVGASELAKRNFAQYASANGLNSGAGGQAELSRNIALQNNMNSINSQEAQSVADLQLQRATAEVEYNNAIAQAQSEGDFELANALYQEKVRVQNALINLEIQQYQLEYQAYRDQVGDSQWQQSFDQSVAQQNWQNNFAQQQFDYGKAQDAIANNQWQQSFDQSVAQQNWQNAFNQQQFDYGKTQDAIANGQWQQSFDQNVAQQNWQNNFAQQQFDYGKAQDVIANNQWQQSFDQAATQQDWENALALQKYKDALEQQQFENGLATQKYQDSQTANQKEMLASYGAAYLEAGVMPSAEMLTAMGITEADAKMYITAVKNKDGVNYTTVGEALLDMVRAGANKTELRSALRGALNEGILTQAEYEQLCGIYIPGWST